MTPPSRQHVLQHKITNLFTVGPRLGYAWDRLMIFATGVMLRPTLRARLQSQSPVFATGARWRYVNGASRNNGWYAGGGFDYMVHKGPLVDVILGLDINITTSARRCVLLQPGLQSRTDRL